MIMKKTITFAALMILLATGNAHAGFTCINEEKGIEILAEHEAVDENLSTAEKEKGFLSIKKSGGALFEGEVLVSVNFTRVGKRYSYNLSDGENLSFSISETTKVTTSPIGCHPHSRMTCDFDFVNVHIGHLNIKGEDNVVLDCKAI